MKTRFYSLLLLIALVGLAACDDIESHPSKNVLNTPEVTVSGVKESTAVLTWKAVGNANAYLYSLNGGSELTTESNTIELKGLEPEKSYTFKVKAQKSGSLYFDDSEYAETTFTTTSHVAVYRVATFADDWDTWHYDYNTDGTIKHVYRLYNGEIEREWLFAYSGNSLTVTGRNNYSIVLNNKGYAATLSDGSSQYVYTYNDEGYLIKVERDGNIYSNIVVEGGNIVKWSRFTDGVEQFKLHTYTSVPNVGGSHCIYSERAGVSRWLAETGLFGKASAYCHATNVWDYSATSSVFTFKYDSNGCIQQEVKDYNGSIENFFYTYHVE